MSLDDVRTIVNSAIEGRATDLAKVADTIFTNPELNFEETVAHNCLCEFLEDAGFIVERQYVLSTAFRATFSTGQRSNPNIGILCEYDALPEIGHACGHNLIAEIGLGAAIGIKAALESLPDNTAKVTVIGCPAEEGGGGKIKLIDAGVFNDIDVAMMSHPSVANLARPMLPGIKSLVVRYTGQASHGCTAPWEGINALDAAVMAYQSLALLRQQCKPHWRIGAVITKGGIESTIIPQHTEMKISYRAMTKTELALLGQKVEKCIESAATSTGCKVDINYLEDSYLSMLHNRCMSELYENHCVSMGVQFTQDPDIVERMIFSTDMGDVSYKVPSIHPIYDILRSNDAPNHSVEFAAACGSSSSQKNTLIQAKALALTALDIINKSNVLDNIKEDFKQSL